MSICRSSRLLGVVVVVVAVLSADMAEGSSISALGELQGERSTGGGGLEATGNQSGNGFTLKWDITLNNVTNLYHYKYEIFEGDGITPLAPSHFNIEVSSFFEAADMLNPSVTPDAPGLIPSGSGNPGMPSDIGRGVKFDVEAATYEFDSPKIPVYADVYGKKGNGGFWNTGFGLDPTAPFTNWIAAPDTDDAGTTTTAVVPLPGAAWMGLALFGSLVGASLIRRRR